MEYKLYTSAQNLPNRNVKVRINMLLDGKDVVEIDIKSSFVRMAIASENVRLPDDPYMSIANKAKLTRNQVKRFFIRAFGSSNRGFNLKDDKEPENSITKEDRVLLEKIVQGTYPKVF